MSAETVFVRILVCLLVSAVGLSACKSEATEEAKLIEAAKVAVAAKLLDPTSPLFTEVTVRGIQVCGLVNAKNAYGAYAGTKRFVSTSGSTEMEPEPASPLIRPEVGRTVPCMFEHSYNSCKTGAVNDGLTTCFAWLHDDVDHTPGTPVITKAIAAAACLKALDVKFDSDIRPAILTARSSRSVVNDRGTWSVEVRYNAADDANDSGVESKGQCQVNANGIARVSSLVME